MRDAGRRQRVQHDFPDDHGLPASAVQRGKRATKTNFKLQPKTRSQLLRADCNLLFRLGNPTTLRMVDRKSPTYFDVELRFLAALFSKTRSISRKWRTATNFAASTISIPHQMQRRTTRPRRRITKSMVAAVYSNAVAFAPTAVLRSQNWAASLQARRQKLICTTRRATTSSTF